MPIDPETLRELLAVGGSIAALCSTMYFWLVRTNRERPNLSVHPVFGIRGSVLLHEDYETFRRVSPGAGEVCAKYYLDVAVLNNSTLPNALLAVRVSIRFADGRWRQMDVRRSDSSESLLPLNVSPLTTATLPLAISAAIPGRIEGGNQDRVWAAGDALPPLVPIKIELEGVVGKHFVTEWLDSGKELERTPAETERLAA